VVFGCSGPFSLLFFQAMNISPSALRLSLTRRSLARFATAVMPSYELDACHKLMIERVEDLLAGRIKKLAIVTPPRIGKTFVQHSGAGIRFGKGSHGANHQRQLWFGAVGDLGQTAAQSFKRS
jgi:hypothetical protein